MLFSIHFYPLYIIGYSVVLYVENAILNDLGTLYIVTQYLRNEVFSSSAEFKPHGDVTGTESGSKAGRVVYCAEAGIGIRGVESLVEKDYAVVAVEHQITGVDCAGLVCGGGERRIQVMVFLIAVQFVHRDSQGQQRSKGFTGFGVGERGGKGL